MPNLNPPVDPAFVAFRDGVIKAHKDEIDQFRWRWSPKHAGWFTYAVKDWILDDVQIPDTPCGSYFELIWNDEPAVELARANSYLPDVFARVQSDYARRRAARPDLVWNWRGGGDWRDASSRDGSAGIPGTKDGDIHILPKECQQRIDDVRAYVARGDITASQAQKLIAKIVDDCTSAG